MAPAALPERAELLNALDRWVDAGALRALDVALTRFIAEHGAETDPAVLLALALTSERNGHGHVCLDLAGALAEPQRLLGHLREDEPANPLVRGELSGWLASLSLTDWVARLSASLAVSARPFEVSARMLEVSACPIEAGASLSEVVARASDDDAGKPFVLASSAGQPLLYLRRYWRYEQQIRQGIAQRLATPIAVDESALRAQLEGLFEPAPSRSTAPPSSSSLLPSSAPRSPALRSDLLSPSPSPPPASLSSPDWQRIACGLAARQAFFIITGGPGTGKTTTVVRLLAVLQGLAAEAGSAALRIELAAPTGKAAARLTESIRSEAGKLPDRYRSRAEIPTEVKTLHRLLGSLPNSRHFRHHPANPLPADLVVVDEASMVDVEMMAQLIAALRPQARLVLLGDKDQLSSVEAGAVLGDLCQRAERSHYRADTAQWVQRVTGQVIPDELIDDDGGALDQSVVMLRKSYRFSEAGGIGALAKLVNAGDAAAKLPSSTSTSSSSSTSSNQLRAVLGLFDQDQDPALGLIRRMRLADINDPAFARLILEAYDHAQSYLRKLRETEPPEAADQAALDAWAAGVIDAQKGFQLLTPLRQGPWGVAGLNQRIIDLLNSSGLLRGPGSEPDRLAAGLSPRQWFAGRPVLVTHNDYGLNLMNGDIGVTLSVRAGASASASPDSAKSVRRLRVAFPSPDGRVRWVLPSRLQHVETVFAMTVHKSQGSEFTHTALVLPETSNPVLTRELFYTAITRAKQRFTLLYSHEGVLREALGQRVQRVSGLRDLA